MCVESSNSETIVYKREEKEDYEEINAIVTSYKPSQEYCDSGYKLERFFFNKEEFGRESFTCRICKQTFSMSPEVPFVFACVPHKSCHYCASCIGD